MLLLEISRMREDVENLRREMCNLAKIKGLSDPEVVRKSQELDKKILIMQQMVYTNTFVS